MLLISIFDIIILLMLKIFIIGVFFSQRLYFYSVSLIPQSLQINSLYMNKCVLLLFLFSFLLYSCQDDSAPLVLYDVDQDFKINFRERLTATSQELLLDIESIAGFSCEEVVVTSEFIQEGNTLTLAIKEIKFPLGCEIEEGEYTAKRSLNLGALSSGEYDFILSIEDAIFNYGKLVVTNLGYELLFDTELNGIELLHSNFLKIPEETVWGRFKHNNSNTTFLLEEINQSMLEAGATVKVLPEGKYTNFEIDSDGMWEWDTPNNFNVEYSVVYNYPLTSYAELEALSNQIKAEYGNDFDFDFDVYTYTGERF
ncbi:MAG: hypothetical protein ACI94Y_001358 [Maribacter sp.]